MDLQLRSKTAFVSGWTKGIGFAIARRLLMEGAAVIINGRTGEKLDHALNSLKAEMPDAAIPGIVAGCARLDEVETLMARSVIHSNQWRCITGRRRRN